MGSSLADPPLAALAVHTSMQQLAPSIVTVWKIKAALFWSVGLLGALSYEVVNLFDDDRWLPMGVLVGLVLSLGLLATFVVPPLRYRFWRYRLSEDELFLKRGIYNRIDTIVPLRRIQHLDVSQDLLEREFSLGRLIVHTAGTRSNTVVLPGLPFEEAERLRDTVKQYILEDAV